MNSRRFMCCLNPRIAAYHSVIGNSALCITASWAAHVSVGSKPAVLWSSTRFPLRPRQFVVHFHFILRLKNFSSNRSLTNLRANRECHRPAPRARKPPAQPIVCPAPVRYSHAPLDSCRADGSCAASHFDAGRWCARPCDGQLPPAKRSVVLLKCDACRRPTSCLLPRQDFGTSRFKGSIQV